MEKEKKQILFETKVWGDLQELYPDTAQLSKVVNQAVAEYIAKEKLIRMQEKKLIEVSKQLGLPTDMLQATLIARALEQTDKKAE